MGTREFIQNIIDNFDLQRWKRFFSEKNSKFRPSEESFDYYNTDNFSAGLKLGELALDDGTLLFCAFEAKQELSERSGKKAQYELGKKILKETQTDAGIFIYYNQADSFRFSLIYANYLGKKRDWSAFRRFTYFVSKELTNKTFKQRIGDEKFSSLAMIKDAFSVEKVTSKFFEDFRLIFERTKQQFEKQNKNTVCLWLKDKYPEEEYKEQINRFVYTFLGRIVFIYFLQRKGWVENQVDYIRKTLENDSNKNFYLKFFQPLFFDVFAKKESERPTEIKTQYKDTPYLNGGLFEKSELENSLEEKGIFILFDDKFIREIILDFFENYNFTIDENSPDDQEVSIDPEMLGKVFENTLAEEERGKKGTFYTPREVVHFMVKDSLSQFLQNETNIDKEKLHKLIYHKAEIEDLGFEKDEIRLVDCKLEHIKVLDPAVGSAAFPVEMMQILVNVRKRLNVNVGKNINEVSLKKHFIKDNLYGVDIDPGAIEIAKLRLWLSLIVDYQKSEAEPLPNLDFQFRVGNSLQERIEDIDIFQEEMVGQNGLFKNESEYEKMKDKMIFIKDKFYLSDNEGEKKKLKKQFDSLEQEFIQAVLKNYDNQFKSHFNNIDTLVKGQKNAKVQKEIEKTIKKITNLEKKIKDGTYKLFKPDFHFSEVFDRKDKNGNKIGGFDIVIGNPPYGVKVEDVIKEWHGLGSKDSYGVFISTAIKRFLKPGGILSYIVSDTWLTIKTHKPLREQVLSKQLHKIVRLHQDCFDATINACIMNLTNSSDNNSKLIVADLTNISTRKEVEEMREKLYHLEKFVGQFTPKYAVYEYSQDLIKTNSNLPIFVGSPKLFALMNDTTCQTLEKEIGGEKVKVRQIELNGKTVELVRFGDIAEVKHGLTTGDTKKYIYKKKHENGSFEIVDESKIFSEDNFKYLTEDEKMHGVQPKKYDGKYLFPYDKGGSSDSTNGWLPRYYIKTGYYINWSIQAVNEMKKLPGFRHDGKDFYFKTGISFSHTGIYSPTFRFSCKAIFDTAGSSIFCSVILLDELICTLNSKILLYLFKSNINHTVNTSEDPLKIIPITTASGDKLFPLLKCLRNKQEKNIAYDYCSHEQIEIDCLIYEAYGLNAEDVEEVENWYSRRYPKLSAAQKVNLRKLGKSDNYLVLYGLKAEK
ncbi:MAG: N-6 DNA methylase [Acidobacteria bacterium]|nr:N-6 DNA methylase [Acidobacteriota bacterium]MBU4306882.1 N-6 DNA methylase [Acidobacteriota bacterium]MCG2810296.1 N-6 DNA methylase [Candidatus Aminicenantes bacterium]